MSPGASSSTMPTTRNRSPEESSSEDNRPTSSARSRKSSEKTEDEESPTSSSSGKRKGVRPKSRSNKAEEDRADVDNEPSHYQDFDEDDSDDDLGPAGSKKNPKYYIVKNEKNGRPTEVFRTDRLHALRQGAYNKEDSDDEHCGPFNGLLKLHDRWREEWNYGIQVPVNCQSLPEFVTAPSELSPVPREPFQLPSKYISTTPISSSPEKRHPSSPVKYAHHGTHVNLPLPTRQLYNADRMDEIWLEKNNKRRKGLNKAPIVIEQFLKLMDALEVMCYRKLHDALLEPLHQQRTLDVHDDDACDVCGSKEHDEGDDILYCDDCNACFHLSCYGLEEVPQDVWKCMKCRLCGDNVPPCIMCPTVGGALKQTEPMADGQPRWCHVGCALWIPECRFENPETRDKIIDIDAIPDERWHKKCAICDTRRGCCIQCSVSTCKTAFHVACATRSGYEMRIEADPANPDGDHIQMIALCQQHRTVKTAALGLHVSDSAVGGNKTDRSKLSSDEELDETENAQLKQLQARFFMYIDEDVLTEELFREMEPLIVSDVYEYWKLKRNHLGGGPLIRNPQDDIPTGEGSCAAMIRESSLQGTFHKSIFQLRQTFDKSRILCHLNLQREKAKQLLVETEVAIVGNMWQQILSQVPMSDRATSQLVESLKASMKPEEIAQAEEMEEDLMEGVSSVPSSSSSTDSSEAVKPTGKRVLKRPRTELLEGQPSPKRDSPKKRVKKVPVRRTEGQAQKREEVVRVKQEVESEGEEEEVVATPKRAVGKKTPVKKGQKVQIQIKEEILSDQEEAYLTDEGEETKSPAPPAKSSLAKPKQTAKKLSLPVHRPRSYRPGSRYNPMPTSDGQIAEPRARRSQGPAKEIRMSRSPSPQAPSAKRARLEVRTPGEGKISQEKPRSVKETLMDVFNADRPLPPTPLCSPPLTSPSSSSRRHYNNIVNPEEPPLHPGKNRLARRMSSSDSDYSVEIGFDSSHIMRKAPKKRTSPRRASPRGNLKEIPNFIQKQIKEEPYFDGPESSPPPSSRTRRASPLKESPVRQAAHHDSSTKRLRFIEDEIEPLTPDHDLSPPVSQRTRRKSSLADVHAEQKPII